MPGGDGEREQSDTLRACDDAATLRGDVDASNGLVVALQFILQLERAACFPVELDKLCPWPRPESGDLPRKSGRQWAGGKVVHLGRRHCEQR